MNDQRIQSWFTLIIFLVIAITSCGMPSNQEPEDTLSGTITVSGAWALYPLMIRWSEEFRLLYPEVRIDVSAGGAGKGMADALAGIVDIGMVSREIYPDEIDKGAFWIPVAKDAVFLTINNNNPVLEDLRQKGVSRETLIGIYITGTISTWGQVVGRPDVTDSIHVFTRSDAAGAPATWANYLGGTQEDLLGVGVYGDPGLLEAVVKDPLGLGYNNLNYAFDPGTGLPVFGAFVVPLDTNLNGIVDAEEKVDTKQQAVEAVAAGNYPSPPSRDLNLVTLGKPEGLTRVFILWILQEGQNYVEETGYVPLQDDKLSDALREVE